MKRCLSLILACLLSAAFLNAEGGADIGVRAARHVLGLFVGHKAWELVYVEAPAGEAGPAGAFHHFRAEGADGEGEDGALDFFIQKSTGDIYDAALAEPLQYAEVLLALERDAAPDPDAADPDCGDSPDADDVRPDLGER